MSCRAAMRTRMLSDSSVTDLIGSGVNARLWYNSAPQSPTSPWVVYWIDSEGRASVHGDLVECRMQVAIYGTGPGGGIAIIPVASALRSLLDNYRGTSETVVIRGVFLSDETDRYEPPDDGGEIGTHVIEQEYVVWYKETAPSQPE